MVEDPHKLAAMVNKSQRLVLGLLVLLLVDIIWVSSSEFTKVRGEGEGQKFCANGIAILGY